MADINKLIKKLDDFQMSHRFISFLVAVFNKYGKDEAGNLAALITYFGFVSLFPLLLVLFSILRYFSVRNNEFEQKIITATLHYFPVASNVLLENIHGFHRNGINLFIAILITIYGARGVAGALQDASNKIWQIPKKRQPDFWHKTLNSLGIIVFGGIGMITSTLIISNLAGVSDKTFIFKLFIWLFAFILNACVFMLIFRLATSNEIPSKYLILGALVSGFFFQILQSIGGFILFHQFKHSSQFYGIFAITLGMIFWIYLQAQITLYALEINVVRVKKLWPKSIQE